LLFIGDADIIQTMRINTCLLLLSGWVVLSAGSVYAQTSASAQTTSGNPKFTSAVWKESVVNLKQSADALAKDYDQLVADNDQLRRALLDLKGSMEEAAGENERLRNEPVRLKGLIEEQDQKIRSLSKEFQIISAEIPVFEKEYAALTQQLSKITEKQKPLEGQVADLQAKKIALEMDLKLQNSTPEAEKKRLTDETENLRLLITDAQQRTKVAQDAVKALNAESSSSTGDLQKAREENRKLSLEAQNIRNLIRQNDEYVQKISDKNARIGEEDRGIIDKKTLEKFVLEEEIRRMDAKTAEASGQDAELISSPQAVLMDDLDAARQENDDLKKKISDLNEVTVKLQRDNSMAQALLNNAKRIKEPPAVETKKEETAKRANVVEDAVTHEAMGYAFAVQGKYDEAVTHYLAALKEGGNAKNIHFNLGFVYFKMGNIPEAIKNYSRVLEIDPLDQDAKRSLEEIRALPSP